MPLLALVAPVRGTSPSGPARFSAKAESIDVAGVTITLIDPLPIIPSRGRFHSVTRLHSGLHPKIARRYPQGYILGFAIRTPDFSEYHSLNYETVAPESLLAR